MIGLLPFYKFTGVVCILGFTSAPAGDILNMKTIMKGVSK